VHLQDTINQLFLQDKNEGLYSHQSAYYIVKTWNLSWTSIMNIMRISFTRILLSFILNEMKTLEP